MVLNPGQPADVSVDHSLAVEAFAQKDAPTANLQIEIRRTLEQQATVVTTEQYDGVTWAVPDQMIGIDSHTPMVNGIGVLAWGVGGLEAQTVMFGCPQCCVSVMSSGFVSRERCSQAFWPPTLR